MTEADVDVSVIVPVRDRRDLLADLLAGLEAQRFGSFEVVVVDDGSTDGSREMAAQTQVHGRAVRVLDAGGRGAVAARCLAVEHTTAPYLAFTDSDCVPDPEWLATAVAALEAGADLAHGPTSPARPPRPLERTLWSEREGLFPTCNVLYRRDAYLEAGGFDRGAEDRLGFRPHRRAKGLGFGEDTLLAWRVRGNGGSACYVPDARVLHHVFPPDLAESFSRSVMGAAFPGLVREVPQLRDTMLKQGVFLGGTARVPFYAMVAATIARRPLVAGAAGAAWTVVEWRRLRRSFGGPTQELAKVLPIEMALDAVVGVGLLVGSVRHRRVVL